jgi:hypothetical protein
MGNVMTVLCRSYSARAFDGCPACVDAALDAVSQAAVYVLGRTAPNLGTPGSVPVEMSYRIRVSIADARGALLASDELEVEQTIGSALPIDDFAPPPDEPDQPNESDADPDGIGHDDGLSSMGLDDFQTVLNRVELAPSGSRGMNGLISGDLFGFERLIGAFEASIEPGC